MTQIVWTLRNPGGALIPAATDDEDNLWRLVGLQFGLPHSLTWQQVREVLRAAGYAAVRAQLTEPDAAEGDWTEATAADSAYQEQFAADGRWRHRERSAPDAEHPRPWKPGRAPE